MYVESVIADIFKTWASSSTWIKESMTNVIDHGDQVQKVILMPMPSLKELVILDHVERKVPKYEYHNIRERKVKTLTRN